MPGHQVEVWAELDPRVGSMCMVQVDQASGARLGAADPRSVAYAMGW